MAKTTRTPAKRASGRAGTTAVTVSTQPAGVSEWEWDLPAGFTVDGSRMATLREVIDPRVPTRTLTQLSEDHKIDLAAKRIEMAPDSFQVVIPGHGTLGKARAAAEVRDRSRIGRYLAEIQYFGVRRGMEFGRLARQRKGDAGAGGSARH